MQKMYFEPETHTAYVILKIDKATIIREARITQVIENPLRYFVEGQMNLSSDAVMRASWK